MPIFYAPAGTGRMMSKNTAVVIVIYMFLPNGMKAALNTNMFRKEGPKRRSVFEKK
jgi:hypothetical protein